MKAQLGSRKQLIGAHFMKRDWSSTAAIDSMICGIFSVRTIGSVVSTDVLLHASKPGNRLALAPGWDARSCAPRGKTGSIIAKTLLPHSEIVYMSC